MKYCFDSAIRLFHGTTGLQQCLMHFSSKSTCDSRIERALNSAHRKLGAEFVGICNDRHCLVEVVLAPQIVDHRPNVVFKVDEKYVLAVRGLKHRPLPCSSIGGKDLHPAVLEMVL